MQLNREFADFLDKLRRLEKSERNRKRYRQNRADYRVAHIDSARKIPFCLLRDKRCHRRARGEPFHPVFPVDGRRRKLRGDCEEAKAYRKHRKRQQCDRTQAEQKQSLKIAPRDSAPCLQSRYRRLRFLHRLRHRLRHRLVHLRARLRPGFRHIGERQRTHFPSGENHRQNEHSDDHENRNRHFR